MEKKRKNEEVYKDPKKKFKKEINEDNENGDTSDFKFTDPKPVLVKYDYKTQQTQWIDPVWDPRFTIGIFGSRGTGKSFLARWLCSMFYHYYPEVYVFTETRMNKYWEQMVNPSFIYEGYQRDVLAKILDNQTKKTEAWRQGKFKGNPLALIIWDDCLPSEMNYEKDSLFQKIYFNGRHHMIGNIMNSQYFFKIPKRYRANIDFNFSMMQEQFNQLEGFYNEYAYAGKGGVENARGLFNSFIDLFKKATEDKKFILFSVRDKTIPSWERIYSGKAEDPGVFWMGSAVYWSKNQKHLEKIKSGKAREEAEKDLEDQWEKWKLLPPGLEQKNKKK